MKFPTNWWGGGIESECGAGSKAANMVAVSKELPPLLKELAPQNILEIGCGDLNFAKYAVLPTGIPYSGVDIKKRSTWKSFSQCTLSEKDVTQESSFEADLIIARDFFIHLPNVMVLQILWNLKCKWLLSTTYPGANNFLRMKSPSAGFEALDLATSPFDLKSPIRTIQEHVSSKFLGLWVFNRGFNDGKEKN